MGRNPNMPFHFALPPLPKNTYKLLSAICIKEGVGQWLAVIAAIEALRWIKNEHPEQMAGIWQRAREATLNAAGNSQ